jgi:hypothetical protein
MPFTPELFSARVLERLEEQRRRQLAAVSYFDGLLGGQVPALVASGGSVRGACRPPSCPSTKPLTPYPRQDPCLYKRRHETTRIEVRRRCRS